MKRTGPASTPAASTAPGRSIRTSLDVDAIAECVVDNLRCLQGTSPAYATRNDWYLAVAYTVRDRVLAGYAHTAQAIAAPERAAKTVAYLSAEFLVGPHLDNCLLALGIRQATAEALSRLGQDLARLIEQEEEPGLGNGGLGRLAACYMDSLATLKVPAIGYGIRYEFGIFDQAIQDGWQVERTDKWLRYGNPWEIPRAEITFDVKQGGRTESYTDEAGRFRVRWVPKTVIKGVAYDTPIPGYRVGTTNLLRLWKAEATESFDFEAFNVGDYYGAVHQKVGSETISKVLYPNDEPEAGKQLRLAQQYFFVSCSLQDILRIQALRGRPVAELDASWAAQLNDTHPSIAVAELMRLLVDEHGLAWDDAWGITQRTCGYTNHTLLAEALETWPVRLFGALLPRHLEIVYEINRRFLDGVRAQHPGDDDVVRRLSLIDDAGEPRIRMAHLACVGSHAINGVAELHSTLLKETVLRDMYRIAPEKFRNVTNGVTPRRWLALCNPALGALITRHVGDRWVADLEGALGALEPLAQDAAFREEWRAIKAANKRRLAALVRDRTGVTIDPATLFDIQVKRLHEYKRQHLTVLQLVAAYNRLKQGASDDIVPRTVIFGGKAAPGYAMAKLIIKLITSVGAVINSDPTVADRLKVVFLPDFNVKTSHHVYPAAELSEQISTAGKEASGTGNMKFALNGALTIGTLDGANIEIRDAVGSEHFFAFGLSADDVAARKAAGYAPREVYEANPELREVLDQIADGAFSNGERDLFRPLVDGLLAHDPYMLLEDFAAYRDAHGDVARAYRDAEHWTRMSILNCARVGRFSSDRAIREYCRDIWHVGPLA